MARKPGKKQMENPVGCTGEGKDEKEIREEYREDKMGEELRQDFNGVKVFRVLDQNWGYNQYQLAEGESRGITAYQTHRGIKSFKRLYTQGSMQQRKYSNMNIKNIF